MLVCLAIPPWSENLKLPNKHHARWNGEAEKNFSMSSLNLKKAEDKEMLFRDPL